MNNIPYMPELLQNSLVIWQANAVFALGIVLLVKRIFQRRPPLEAEFATKKELQEVKSEMRLLSAQMREDSIRLMAADEMRSAKIHKRIDALVDAVGELRGILKKIINNGGI